MTIDNDRIESNGWNGSVFRGIFCASLAPRVAVEGPRSSRGSACAINAADHI